MGGMSPCFFRSIRMRQDGYRRLRNATAAAPARAHDPDQLPSSARNRLRCRDRRRVRRPNTWTQYRLEKANARTSRSAADHRSTDWQSGPVNASAGGGISAMSASAPEVSKKGKSVSSMGARARMNPEAIITAIIT